MEEVEKLLASAVAELEKILSSKTVVGEPITIGEATLIPLVSVGFGFGAGGGSGTQPGQTGQGSGGGTGGGGGIKPIAVVIIDKQGVRRSAWRKRLRNWWAMACARRRRRHRTTEGWPGSSSQAG